MTLVPNANYAGDTRLLPTETFGPMTNSKNVAVQSAARSGTYSQACENYQRQNVSTWIPGLLRNNIFVRNYTNYDGTVRGDQVYAEGQQAVYLNRNYVHVATNMPEEGKLLIQV